MSKGNDSFWSKPGRDNQISLLGVLLTLGTIIFGIYQINQTHRNSLFLEQKSNMMEQAEELPMATSEFLRTASQTLIYKMQFDATNSEEDELLFEEYNEKQVNLLDELMYLNIAYGSEDSIKVFTEFSNALKQNQISPVMSVKEYVPMYYSLPLFASLVKYDVTGEIANPKVMYELLMPEFHLLAPPIIGDLIEKNNNLVDLYKLPEEFIWEVEM